MPSPSAHRPPAALFVLAALHTQTLNPFVASSPLRSKCTIDRHCNSSRLLAAPHEYRRFALATFQAATSLRKIAVSEPPYAFHSLLDHVLGSFGW